MTEGNLNNAYAGESMAHMRYLIFSDCAEKEGKSNIARLFRSIAFAEQIHATNHYRELKAIRHTPENLQMAIDGETYEVEEMYPAYKMVAGLQDEKGAQRSATWAWEAEKIHAALYQKAKQAAEANRDIELSTMYICEVCGYTVEGKTPDTCPICKSRRESFRPI